MSFEAALARTLPNLKAAARRFASKGAHAVHEMFAAGTLGAWHAWTQRAACPPAVPLEAFIITRARRQMSRDFAWIYGERPRGHRRRFRYVPLAGDDFAIPDDFAADLERRDWVHALLATLRPHERAVIVLQYLDGLTGYEAARVLHRRHSDVKHDTLCGLARMRGAPLPPPPEKRRGRTPRHGIYALALVGALLGLATPAHAATLSFTTPMWEERADTTCGEAGQPLGDLARVTLYGAKRYASGVRLLRVKPEYLAGLADTLSFPDSGAVWTCWVTFIDLSGNESCRSNLVGINLVADVPGGAPVRDWRVLDISGRLVATLARFSLADALVRVRSRPPGFYYLRSTDGMAARTVLVVH